MILTDAYAKLRDLYQDAAPARLLEALRLVASDGVHATREEDTYQIWIAAADLDACVVTKGHCDCDPLADAGAPPCAHMMAVELMALLQDQTPQTDAGGVVVPLVERHVERIVSGALMTEAPYSVNVSVEDAEGFQFMFTVRKQDPHLFFEAITALRGWLKKRQFTPVHRGFSPQPVPPQTPEGGEGSEVPTHHRPLYSFHAETLHRNEMEGKSLYAVKGADIPPWNKKYGMRVWPEVLEAAGFELANLETVRSADLPSLKGYIAEYQMREDDPKKPDKIIRLVKEG